MALLALHLARAARSQPRHWTAKAEPRGMRAPQPVHRTVKTPSDEGSSGVGGGGGGGGGGRRTHRATPEMRPARAGSSSANSTACSPPRLSSCGTSSWTAAPMACVVTVVAQRPKTSLEKWRQRASTAYCTTAMPAREAEKAAKPRQSSARLRGPRCSSPSRIVACPPTSRPGASRMAAGSQRVKASPHTVGISSEKACGASAIREKTTGATPRECSSGSRAPMDWTAACEPAPSSRMSGTHSQRL